MEISLCMQPLDSYTNRLVLSPSSAVHPDDDPPPVIIAIVGPPGVGKLPCSKVLLNVIEANGPITVVIGKIKWPTFVKCNERNSMIEMGKSLIACCSW